MKNWFSTVIALIALLVSVVLAVFLRGLPQEVQDLSSRVAEAERAIPGSVAPLEEKIAGLEEDFAKIRPLSTAFVEMQKRLEALEGLAQDVNKLSGDLQKAYGEVAELRKDLEALEALSGEVRNLREEIPSVVEEKTRDFFQGLTGELARLEETLQSDRKRLEALENLSVDERFSALLQYVDKKLGELREEVKGLEARWEKEFGAEKAKYEALDKAFVALRGYVDEKANELEQSITDAESRRENLRREVLTLLEERAQAWQEIETRLQELEKKIHTLSIDERFAAFLKYLEEKVGKLRDELEEVRTRVVTVEDLRGTLRTLEDKLKMIEEEVQRKGEDLQKYLKSLQEERMTFLEKRLEELSTSLTSFEEAFRETQKNLDSIVAQLSVLEEKLLSLEKNMGTWREEVFQSLRKEIEALPTSQDLEEIRKDLDALFADREELRLKLQAALAEYERIVEDLERKGKDIALLREEMQRVTGPELESLQRQLGAFSSVQRGLEEKLQKTEEGIRALQEALQMKDEEIETVLHRITQNVQVLSERLEAFGKRLEELGVLLPLRENFGILEARLAEIEKFSKEVLKRDLEVKMQSLEETITALRAEVGKVAEESKVSSANWQSVLKLLESLEESKASLEQKVQELYELLEGREKKEAVEKDVQSLVQEKEALRLKIEELAKERMNLEGELEKRKQELVDIERQLAQLRAEKGSAERIKELEKAREEALREIERLKGTLKAKDDRIADLQRKNEELTLQLEETKKFTSYVILPWDNLWKIARRYYRDGRKWTVIWEANRDKIPDPQRLQPYVEIRIPRVPDNTLTK
ncbi:hypothetical protein [Candidatus Caldatribacterium sp.]|uniref:hypothetical protein n=1 Tax=Candidatus Caldatribacterium sp. TaxID=2282143 RepID=UPI002999B2A7|nr:LysM peptidoglycan-binding domain-containing protein [Candidatus Caldatribacterium sp.]MDW8080381.1 LysM peptidoglycan-binding domain-containing protein [Candidatus Calescibacterium sp.]